MKSFGQLHQETNALQFEFLMLDVKTGGTFLDIVQTSLSEETRTRNLQNAVRAYDTVVRFRPRVILTEQQAADLERELDSLRARIESFEAESAQRPNQDAGLPDGI